MLKRLESKIMESWNGTAPVVSVVCFSFNFEKYISQTIDSILNQITKFPFELIIHDDASTDGSRLIINDFQRKYPNIIRVIQQTENQFTNGKRIILLATEYAKADYVMYCDGDDYWHDIRKIEIQYAKMIKNPDINISFHPVRLIKENGEDIQKIRGFKGSEDQVYSQSKAIQGGGSFMLTPSIMIKKKSIDQLPDWFNSVGVGDYFFQVLLSCNGALYINKTLSTYRINSINSFTVRNKRCKERFRITIKNLYGLSRLFFYLKGVRVKVDIIIRAAKICIRLFYCLKCIKVTNNN